MNDPTDGRNGSWRTALDAEVDAEVRDHLIGVQIARLSAELRAASERGDENEIRRLSAERAALLRRRGG